MAQLRLICKSKEEKLHDSSVKVIGFSGASDGINDERRCATSRRNDLLFAGDVVAISRRCGSRWESSNERGGKEHDGQVLSVSSNAQRDGAVRRTGAHEWQSNKNLKALVSIDLLGERHGALPSRDGKGAGAYVQNFQFYPKETKLTPRCPRGAPRSCILSVW